ncbi:MAG: HpaII family restriction endonuclease [Patescibacteria group bacterium]
MTVSICYHIYNVNEFENYLFNNTKFDTPSTSRYGFGNVYNVDNSLRFNLNLQIRFIK